MRSTCIFIALAGLVASTPLLAQGTLTPTAADLPAAAQPSAITGMGSSARHCVSGDAANVHGIGWVDAGTGYTITFDSEVALATLVSRLDLKASDSTGSIGTPGFRATASTPGTMALYVGAAGEGGCYRYKVELTPPAGASVSEPLAADSPLIAKLSKSAGPMAIAGLASSAKHCVSGSYVSNIHEIGRVEQGDRVTITFASDFDPIAGVTLENLVTQRGTFIVDDDSGGNLEPQLTFTASHSSTVALHVAGVTGSEGCYRYKVEIR